MNSLPSEEPTLYFFRTTPDNMLTQPPLVSSLQQLETSFLLVSIKRYPHALVACASAIESAMKAALKIEPEKFINFWDLKEKIVKVKEFQDFTNFSETAIGNFRDLRNKINHYGCSPQDDEISSFYLLEAGFPMIEQCYRIFFQFSLLDNEFNDSGLLPNIAHHLSVAKKVFLKTKDEAHSSNCFASFSHLIRWDYQQHWMLSDWQRETLNLEASRGWDSWEFQMKQKESLTSEFSNSWNFDCPVCDHSECLVCELDQKKMKGKVVSINRGLCTNCGLVISNDSHFLADELCKEQINLRGPSILSEYGII